MKTINEFWAVIPARAGSKSLKNKNIKKFLKLPLMAHSILAAKKNKLIKKIIFSSDSKKYISIAKKYKCDFYNMRTKKNSGDFSTDFDVFHEIILYLKKKKINLPKFFVHFRPTTPIRKNKSITRAIKIFREKNNSFSSLKSISLNSHNSLKDYKIKNKKLFSINIKNKFNIDNVNIPKEKLEKTYIGNGVVDIYKTKNILKGKLLGNKVFPLITDEIFCDIDSLKDFKIGEILAKKLNKI
jgi:CMP-N,N'-diacetyllegionaminic acid synthase